MVKQKDQIYKCSSKKVDANIKEDNREKIKICSKHGLKKKQQEQ